MGNDEDTTKVRVFTEAEECGPEEMRFHDICDMAHVLYVKMISEGEMAYVSPEYFSEKAELCFQAAIAFQEALDAFSIAYNTSEDS